jgi:hypothetical protein
MMRLLCGALVLFTLTSTGSAQTCRQSAGDARARELVRQCRQISPATRPPCHVDNPCALIEDEIRRSCVQRRSEGNATPAFCRQYLR